MDMMIEKICPCCGTNSNIVVDAEAFTKWKNGELIQNVMGDMTISEREILISGLCEPCQTQLFTDEDENE